MAVQSRPDIAFPYHTLHLIMSLSVVVVGQAHFPTLIQVAFSVATVITLEFTGVVPKQITIPMYKYKIIAEYIYMCTYAHNISPPYNMLSEILQF